MEKEAPDALIITVGSSHLGQEGKRVHLVELRGAAPFVRVIGDAPRVFIIANAVYWSYHTALDIIN